MKIDLEKIQFNADSQYHVLRHFNRIDEVYKKQLIGVYSFTNDVIGMQHNIVGSKFFYEFSTNPIEVWEKIKKKIVNVDFFRKKHKVEFTVQFDQQTYPNGIGNTAIVHMNEISVEEKQKIELQNRDGFEVKVLNRANLPITWKVNVIMFYEPDIYKIKTIFPGELAPPFPVHVINSLDEYNKSLEYWNNHLFIKAVK